VLAIGGHDPSGGAGIQADIEAVTGNGCWATTAITALTVQDTVNASRVVPMDPELVVAQALAVLSDFDVSAVKIGILGSAATASALGALLRQRPDIPVVLDPVLAASGGTPFGGKQIIDAIQDLLPLIKVLTPNASEARALCGREQDVERCAGRLLGKGCENVLITGADEPGTQVVNRLFCADGSTQTDRWTRLAGSFHGTGCTLASSLAAGLASGFSPRQAAVRAQRYTWDTLAHALRLGSGQALPDRCPARWKQPR